MSGGVVRLPAPPAQYSQRDQAELRRLIETFLQGVQGLASAGSGGGGGVTLPIAESDVTNLVADLAAKLTQAQADLLYAALGHTHTFASLTSKPTTIAGYGITDFNSLGDARWSLLGHAHAISDITGLVAALAGKMSAVARATVTKTTGSLANNATETGTVTLSKAGAILKVVADRACWVRLYATSSERSADSGRSILVDPTNTIPVLGELIFSASVLTINCAPLIWYANRDGTPATDIYYSITNLSGSTSTVQIDITHDALEA